MWITNDGQVITTPKNITLNGIQHPEAIFRLWKQSELSALGIKPFRPGIVPEGHQITDSSLVEIDGVVHEQVVTQPAPEPIDLRTYIDKRMAEYPSLEELNVALWEKVVEGRSEAAEALEARRQAIKAKYPKSQNGVDL